RPHAAVLADGGDLRRPGRVSGDHVEIAIDSRYRPVGGFPHVRHGPHAGAGCVEEIQAGPERDALSSMAVGKRQDYPGDLAAGKVMARPPPGPAAAALTDAAELTLEEPVLPGVELIVEAAQLVLLLLGGLEAVELHEFCRVLLDLPGDPFAD